MCIYPHWLTIAIAQAVAMFVLFLDGYKPKIAENEVYITELLKEKTQAEEQKQIITG